MRFLFEILSFSFPVLFQFELSSVILFLVKFYFQVLSCFHDIIQLCFQFSLMHLFIYTLRSLKFFRIATLKFLFYISGNLQFSGPVALRLLVSRKGMLSWLSCLCLGAGIKHLEVWNSLKSFLAYISGLIFLGRYSTLWLLLLIMILAKRRRPSRECFCR